MRKQQVMMMNNGKMIAVWGNKGSGKTTTAVKLAVRLAAMKKEVIVVLTEITAPDINVLLPFARDINTMGNLWATPDCSMEAIYKACNSTNSNYLGILAYKSGENVFSYPDYTKDNIMDIFMKLKNMADYIIVDCVDVFAYNVLTTVALELADKVIRMGEATTKAFSFFDSNLPLLQDSRYKSGQHYKVLAKVKSYQAKDATVSQYGSINAELPYVEELEHQTLEGELFKQLDTKVMKGYNIGLERILTFIIDEGSEENEMIKISEKKEVKKKRENMKGLIPFMGRREKKDDRIATKKALQEKRTVKEKNSLKKSNGNERKLSKYSESKKDKKTFFRLKGKEVS